MNIDHEIDYTNRVVLITLSGAMVDQDLLDLARRIEQIPGMRSDFSILFDLRFADGKKITADGVRAIAARPQILSPQSRRGIVVPSLLGFGMARMYQLFRGEDTTRVFRDYDKARRWVETGKAAE
jgi:hypothetical protein